MPCATNNPQLLLHLPFELTSDINGSTDRRKLETGSCRRIRKAVLCAAGILSASGKGIRSEDIPSRQTDIQGIRAHSCGQSKGRDPRSGPVSRIRTGRRAFIFGSGKCSRSPIPTQHIHRNRERPRNKDERLSASGEMGATGRTPAECSADRPRRSSRHYVLEAAHPSPLARGAFFGCRHFSKTNSLLEAQGKTPIDWQL